MKGSKKVWKPKLDSKVPDTKTYLNALRSNSITRAKQPTNLNEVGNEWLYKSVIAKLSPVRSMALVQDQLRSLGYAVIKVKIMGGNLVVLTFPCVEDRDSMFKEGKFAWIKEWFTETHKWERYTIKPHHCHLI